MDLRPLVIENGNTPVDENFGDDGKPHGDMKTDTGKYAQAKNNVMEGNTFENCQGVCVVWGQEGRPFHPTDNTFKNNILIFIETIVFFQIMVVNCNFPSIH